MKYINPKTHVNMNEVQSEYIWPLRQRATVNQHPPTESSADFHLLGVQGLTKHTREGEEQGEKDSRFSAEELFVARWRRRRFSLSRYSRTWSSWTALWWSWSYSCECCWNPAGVSRCPCSHLWSELRLSCVSPKPWQHFSPVCRWFIHIFPSSFCFRKQSLVLSFAQKLSSGPRETRNFWSVSPSPSFRVFAEAGF